MAPVLVVIMGVAGCGKTTVGRALAGRLGCRFIEGDDYHAKASRQKMASGVALTDEDRWPWLDALGRELARHAGAGESAVLACSALKRAYRDRLRGAVADLRLVFLDGSDALIAARLEARRGHYMPPALLASQLRTLEPPAPEEQAIVVDVGGAACEIAGRILAAL